MLMACKILVLLPSQTVTLLLSLFSFLPAAGVRPRAMCIEGLLNESKKEIIDNEGALKKKLKPARRFCLLSPALKLRW